ncbi:MAG TPA: MEDS domain-containing protein [Ilumatobacteraceae bacterium]|nr:MEDS domain-containing protein [Ilumatobacteraceae bacterium]
MPAETGIRLANGDHVVQFYDRDDDLVGVVGGYLAAAVLDGDLVFVIANQAHRDAFRAALVAAGVDVDAAQVDGALTMLDAAETLRRFTVDGSLDADRFVEAIGEFVGPPSQDGRQVRVYGEMVALLWDAGNVAGAIELEKLWSDLGTRLPFSLFCGYPARIGCDAESADGFAELCHLHSDVVADAPTPSDAETTRGFSSTSQAPRFARRFVAETLQRWGLIDLVDDATLVVSELATNAMMHARSDFTVALSRRGDAVRVEVADSSDDAPQARDPAWMAAGGRGLRVVSAIASRTGHDLVDGGKVVWADLTVGAAVAISPDPGA